ncbi:NADP-dependent malic enzyme [Ignatzschineria ureiclastica]|uniref:NADP-dependent malic enzyme n=1 Tax=Ignatzschineria ureiclastica TaxID=472582 RepID=A0A2U2AH56_9GAMM|nr:NADP-dependent malic enzyme [Ignatzschineria ureiclastica]PWD81992.1 NADP-dependent malic enzyme [Ignatzschineria ureiclastica]GGZ91891.1 malic enzyme [Ignatzschineria ureiclastica]
MDSPNNKTEDLRIEALRYHAQPKPGKISVEAIKPLVNQKDLSLAYSPGVAYACEEIQKDPLTALDYTAKGNLVAVISNGTAVLGLGNIGPLAGKPVMEGKGVLFKNFSDIDVFDIEVDELDPDKFIDIVASLEPTFGGINLEDIKAPECFYIEKELKKRMNIPVFHDDQHGTAIITAAGVINALKLTDKRIEDVKVVCSGAGAAAISCLNLLMRFGLKREHITVVDREGVVNHLRTPESLDEYKSAFIQQTDCTTLGEVIEGADIFLGLSAPRVLTPEMVVKMAPHPLIFALANPEPEIRPELAHAVREDAIIATGRSDYPNQINNVLCFPYLFRGALDCGATEINEAMKMACVEAIAELTHKEPTDEVLHAYPGENLRFSSSYIIPKPFDPRLIVELPIAVAKAAMESGVAQRPITNFEEYRQRLTEHFNKTNMAMRPIFNQAKENARTIAYCEGEDERVLRAVYLVKQDRLANPILIGQPKVIQRRIEELGINLPTKVLAPTDKINKDIMSDYVQIIDYRNPPMLDECAEKYYDVMRRKGITPELARQRMQTRGNLLSAMLLQLGVIDGQISGILGQYHRHVHHIVDAIGLRKGTLQPAAITMLLSPKGPLFFCDTHVNEDPTAEELADITQMAAKVVERFGITPKVALISHSNFGSRESKFARKMQQTLNILKAEAPELECEGEMQPDLALWERYRNAYFPNSELQGMANLFIFANIDTANVTYNFVRTITDSIAVGPILTGISKPAHVVTNIATARRIVNVTAICATDPIE